MSERIAYTFAGGGQIHFAEQCPRGALPIAKADEFQLAEALSELAQPGAVLGEWLVPGMAKAKNQAEKLDALVAFCDRVRNRLLQAA
ncbi:MAG: host nuclease inhibitor protein [Desulfarculus sp.]|nr:host nuclease inhibitor protein [Desulfarculus sp.]